MSLTAWKCPNCAAPLPPSAETTVVCRYCAHVVTGMPAVPWGSTLLRDPWTGRPEDSGRQRVVVSGRPYVVLGLLGRGAHCDVFLGRLDARLTEMVVLKVPRDIDDGERLNREWTTLSRLAASPAQGSAFFSSLLPQRVTHGRLVAAGRPDNRANVYRYRHGFHHTLAQVAAAYPKGVDPRAGVWMWKRALELLGWVHASGYIHGGLAREHLMVHPRDHGMTLTGWSSATPLSRGGPDAGLKGDLAALATSIRSALPLSIPGSMEALFRHHIQSDGLGAWEMLEHLTEASRDAFGPPAYVPFHMPPRES